MKPIQRVRCVIYLESQLATNRIKQGQPVQKLQCNGTRKMNLKNVPDSINATTIDSFTIDAS